MKADNRNLGQLTENMAARYLAEKGYEIIEQNFRNKFGEIDIIARDGKVVVFVEVKAKTGLEFGRPEEMITPGKLTRVRRMANVYLKEAILPCRIDVVAIVVDREGKLNRLTHYQNVY